MYAPVLGLLHFIWVFQVLLLAKCCCVETGDVVKQHLGQYSTAEAGSVGVSKAEFSTSALGHSYTFSSPSASRMSKVGLSDCKECVYSSY